MSWSLRADEKADLYPTIEINALEAGSYEGGMRSIVREGRAPASPVVWFRVKNLMQ